MIFLIHLVLIFAQLKATYGHSGSALLPDKHVTPGEVRTTSTEDVCSGISTKNYRHTTLAEKRTVYKEYHAVKKPGKCCEVDHLIPLELGGADTVKNLWPEPYLPKPGAFEKDKVENYLHKQVCTKQMTLEEAQKEISTDWYEVYKRMPK